MDRPLYQEGGQPQIIKELVMTSKKYPKISYQLRKLAGKPYLPAQGSEGAVFEGAFCEKCIHYDSGQCPVLMSGFVDNKAPEEWVRDQDGYPVCTEWNKVRPAEGLYSQAKRNEELGMNSVFVPGQLSMEDIRGFIEKRYSPQDNK